MSKFSPEIRPTQALQPDGQGTPAFSRHPERAECPLVSLSIPAGHVVREQALELAKRIFYESPQITSDITDCLRGSSHRLTDLSARALILSGLADPYQFVSKRKSAPLDKLIQLEKQIIDRVLDDRGVSPDTRQLLLRRVAVISALPVNKSVNLTGLTMFADYSSAGFELILRHDLMMQTCLAFYRPVNFTGFKEVDISALEGYLLHQNMGSIALNCHLSLSSSVHKGSPVLDYLAHAGIDCPSLTLSPELVEFVFRTAAGINRSLSVQGIADAVRSQKARAPDTWSYLATFKNAFSLSTVVPAIYLGSFFGSMAQIIHSTLGTGHVSPASWISSACIFSAGIEAVSYSSRLVKLVTLMMQTARDANLVEALNKVRLSNK